MSDIQQATVTDTTLQCLIHLMQTDSWTDHDLNNLPRKFQDANTAELKAFRHIKEELTVNTQENVILRGNRIIIPSVLRERAIAIAHEGHQGLVKTKQLLREKVWFPKIDQYVKHKIDTCIACQANSGNSRLDPLQMSPLPPEPWHTVHMDFCGPFPSGEYLFVMIDAYSRYPEVEIVHSTSATTIIPKMDKIFATHGIPSIVKSDNGPPFTSTEIKRFMEENGIQHCRITPLWPQANSEAENLMKPLTKAIRSARVEGQAWKKHLYKFLLNYRATPHCTTKFSPAELLFNRKIKNKLPHVSTNNKPIASMVQINDSKAKDAMKNYADVKQRTAVSDVNFDDLVLVRQRKQNKLSTPYDPSPFCVVCKKGTMITAQRNGKYLTRNALHFKRLHSELHESTEEWKELHKEQETFK